MKILRTFIILLLLTLTGCSSLIVGTGKYRDVLQYGNTREDVRAKIGIPFESGRIEENNTFRSYDWFLINGRVVPNNMDMAGYTQGIILTLGVLDVIFLPLSMVMVPLDSRKEHNLWVYYDEMGNYIIHESSNWPFVTKPPNNTRH